MKHAAAPRRSEFVYMLLTAALLAAIAVAIGGAVLLASHLLHGWALTKQRAANDKRVAEITDSIAKDKDLAAALFQDYRRRGSVHMGIEDYGAARDDYRTALGYAATRLQSSMVELELGRAYAKLATARMRAKASMRRSRRALRRTPYPMARAPRCWLRSIAMTKPGPISTRRSRSRPMPTAIA